MVIKLVATILEYNRNFCNFIKVFRVITAKLLTNEALGAILIAHGGVFCDNKKKLCKKDNGIHRYTFC